MGKIDKYLGKWASRKLLVFILATILIFLGKINPDNWVYLAIVYIFVQGFIDAKNLKT